MKDKDLKIKKDEVLYCKNCLGLYPCWCSKHSYIKTWRFVYEAMKNCKPC